jgi:hypothetical protein
MARKQPRPWIVAPHDPIEQIDDNLWAVDGVVPTIPGGSFRRRMSIVRLADDTLLLHNAVPLDEPGMKRLGELGRPAILVLPSAFHCMDAHAMRERLGAKTYCPALSADRVRQVVEVDGHLDALPSDPRVRFVPLDGTTNGEGVFLVTSTEGARVNMLVCDMVLNIPHGKGLWSLLWRLMGFTGGPRCGPVWLKRAVSDRKALRASIERLAETPNLARIIPSHGTVIDRDAAATLRAVAAPL